MWSSVNLITVLEELLQGAIKCLESLQRGLSPQPWAEELAEHLSEGIVTHMDHLWMDGERREVQVQQVLHQDTRDDGDSIISKLVSAKVVGRTGEKVLKNELQRSVLLVPHS